MEKALDSPCGNRKRIRLPITDEQIEELKANADNINYDAAREQEKSTP